MTGRAPRIISSLQFEKLPETCSDGSGDEEPVSLPKIPPNKGGPLFDDDGEKTSLLKKPSSNSVSLTQTSDITLQEFDYDTDAKYKNPSSHFCLAVVSTFFCVVVGIFALHHAVQSHYYKQAGLLSLADTHGGKAASLSLVAIIMGLIIILWVTVIRMMLLPDLS